MAERSVISVHTTPDTRERLEKLAEATRRSKSFLANEAIEQYLDLHEWQIAEINAGLAELERGEGVPHDEVMAWIESWDSEDRKPRPTAKKA